MSKRSEKQAKKPKKQTITRTYQYRIYPTAKQTRVLSAWLKWCGEIYNELVSLLWLKRTVVWDDIPASFQKPSAWSRRESSQLLTSLLGPPQP